MPVVIKSSENGMVDLQTRTVQLPNYLRPDRSELLRKAAIAATPLLFLSITSLPANATPVPISDSNATIVVDPNPGPTTPMGLTSFQVNTVEQAVLQSFYYRNGSTGALTPLNIATPANAINSINAVQVDTNEWSLNFSDTYTPAAGPSVNYTIDVQYTLSGAPPTGANLTEVVQINNNSATDLPLDIVQYNHFTLNGDTTHNNVVITGGNSASQSLTNGASTTLTETVTGSTGEPAFFDAEAAAALQAEITSAGFTNLSDSTSAGPGDVGFGFEWEKDGANNTATIGPDSSASYQISETQAIRSVPEPGFTAAWIGAVGLWLCRRRRKPATA